MGRLKKRFLQSVFAMLIAVGMVVPAAVSAQAVHWYNFDRLCGSISSLICDVEYTGSWPDGMVRGLGQRNLYQIALQTNTGAGWITVAKTYPETSGSLVTPSVKAGKYNYYRTCVRTVKGGTLWCYAKEGYIYLGD